MEIEMSEALETETETQPSRRIMRPEVAEQPAKEIRRRKRFDSALDRFVSPEERDEIRLYQARHGAGSYPPKFQREIDAAEEKRGARKIQTVGAIAKPASAPKAANTADLYTAKAFAAEAALRLSKTGTALSASQIADLERAFIEYKNK